MVESHESEDGNCNENISLGFRFVDLNFTYLKEGVKASAKF